MPQFVSLISTRVYDYFIGFISFKPQLNNNEPPNPTHIQRNIPNLFKIHTERKKYLVIKPNIQAANTNAKWGDVCVYTRLRGCLLARPSSLLPGAGAGGWGGGGRPSGPFALRVQKMQAIPLGEGREGSPEKLESTQCHLWSPLGDTQDQIKEGCVSSNTDEGSRNLCK